MPDVHIADNHSLANCFCTLLQHTICKDFFYLTISTIGQSKEQLFNFRHCLHDFANEKTFRAAKGAKMRMHHILLSVSAQTSVMRYPAPLSSITSHAFVMHACAFQRTVPHTFTVFQSMIERDRPHHDMRPCREPQRSSRWADPSSTRACQRALVWTHTPY
jgi:hypothetical protein